MSEAHVKAAPLPVESARARKQYVTAGLASLVGTTIEWYDFFLYGTAAALIFNKIFFPAFDPIVGTLAAFATYSVGFFARPLGGIICGHFGDRIGRKSMLIFTLYLMGIPTMLIGLVPSYETIGYWAAVLLVTMRFLQGIAVGGEWGGAVLMAVEHAPKGKKGFFGSLPQTGVAPGLILASFAMAAVSMLPEEDMLSWGWRIPFLASALLLGVGVYIRVRVSESPDFEKMVSKREESRLPLMDVLLKHPRAVLTVIGCRLAEVTWFYTVVVFSLAYATGTLGINKSLMLDATICGAFLAMFMMPLFGALGDRIGPKWVFAAGTVGIFLFGPLFFGLISSGATVSIILAMTIAIGVVYAAMYSPQGALFSAQFPPEVRYSGISLGVQVSGAIGGGLAPLVATWLLSVGDGSPRYVAWYLTILGVIAFLSALRMKTEAPE